jgi:hypothetical protein
MLLAEVINNDLANKGEGEYPSTLTAFEQVEHLLDDKRAK